MSNNLIKDKINKKINNLRKRQEKFKNQGDLFSYQAIANELKGIDFVNQLLLDYEILN